MPFGFDISDAPSFYYFTLMVFFVALFFIWRFARSPFGASLKAFEILGRQFGYSLVGCDILGINAFFVRDDLIDDHFASPFTAENHYDPPRYGLLYRWAHRSRLFGESHNSQ